MKEKILEFLKQQEGFISGQRICDELGVSRTAVWKYMNSLKKEGYEIESVYPERLPTFYRERATDPAHKPKEDTFFYERSLYTGRN